METGTIRYRHARKIDRVIFERALNPEGAVVCILHRIQDATEAVHMKHKEAQQHAANLELRDARRAAINLMEDAVEARRQLEAANAELQHEIADRKRAEHSLRESEEALRQANAQLEARVARRTAQLAAANADLRAQMEAYRRLETEVARLVEDERLHLGMELHDNLCQQLAATSMLTASLVTKLREQNSPHAETLARLLASLKQAGSDAHALARGLLPVQVEADGLMVALEGLAQRTQEMNNVACAFQCAAPVPLASNAVATHLFRIAQEAIHNSIKHGKAKNIVLSLCKQNAITLTVRDDGGGMPPEEERTSGSGLRLMAYRARIIGGSLAISPAAPCGTRVQVELPP
jgi:signal transduction histidine kinase